MNIQQTAKAIRETAKAIREVEGQRYANRVHLVRLSDKMWDLQARYDMLLKNAGLERV